MDAFFSAKATSISLCLTTITKSNNEKLDCFTIKINLVVLIGKHCLNWYNHAYRPSGVLLVPIFKDGIVLFKGITCKIARFDVLNFLMKSFVGVFINYLAILQWI